MSDYDSIPGHITHDVEMSEHDLDLHITVTFTIELI